jgi:hypothetical protein
MTTDESVERMPRGLPWGQLFVGSIVGGISLWMLALDFTGAEPSALLAGVAGTYEAWRDWLITPLERLLQIELSTTKRNLLTFDIVMIGALVRTALRYREVWGVLVFLAVWVAYWSIAKLDDPVGVVTADYILEGAISSAAIGAVLIVFITPLAGMIGRVMEPVKDVDDLTSPPIMLALWNAIALIATSGALLLLDWASRASLT